MRLTAAPDDPDQSADGAGWRALLPLPGRLFIVGDPKQSIYRFRRADIAQYLRAADQVGADPVTLSANFRSTRAVIDFTNDVFSRLITFEPDAQPAFGALDACRVRSCSTTAPSRSSAPQRHDDLLPNKRIGDLGSADALRLREAHDVAATVSTALAEGWPVVDDDTGRLRACRPGDICILLPTRIASARARSRTAIGPARLPGGELLGRLRHGGDPQPDARRCAPPTTRPMRSRSSPRCAARSTGAAMSTSGSGCATAAAGTCGPTPPDGLADHVVARSIAHVRSVAERIGWASPADLLGGDRRRASAVRPRARRRRRTRRVAAPALRDRAGAGMGRRRRARRSALSAVGQDAGLGESRRRHDPSRERPRRRAGDDHPRREGARVPDHDRRRAHHQAEAVDHQRCGVGERHLDARRQRRRRCVRRPATDRRTDGRRRTSPPPVRGVHHGRSTISSCRCTAACRRSRTPMAPTGDR